MVKYSIAALNPIIAERFKVPASNFAGASKGIAVRSGQHCAKMIDSVIGEPATVRMSTYLYTSKEEIDIFIDNLINGGDILDAYFFN